MLYSISQIKNYLKISQKSVGVSNLLNPTDAQHNFEFYCFFLSRNWALGETTPQLDNNVMRVYPNITSNSMCDKKNVYRKNNTKRANDPSDARQYLKNEKHVRRQTCF